MAKKPPPEPVEDLRAEAQRVLLAFLKRDTEAHSVGERERVSAALDVLRLPK